MFNRPCFRLSLLIVALLGVAPQAFTQAIPRPYFQATTEAKQRLVSLTLKIRKGDSAESVIRILGEPTIDQALSRKESDKVVGRELRYYLLRWKNGLVNELHDEMVSVWLDPSNQVKSISLRTKFFND